mgnify:CR=1 FL=1
MMNEQIAEIMDDAQANPEKYVEVVGDVNAAPITKEELLARVKQQNEKKIPSNMNLSLQSNHAHWPSLFA